MNCSICLKSKHPLDNNLLCKDCNKICDIKECQNKKHGIFVLCKQHINQKIPVRIWRPNTECYNTLLEFSHLSSIVNFNINNDNLDLLCNGVHSKVSLLCNKCRYEWMPSIHSFINHTSGCPDCGGKVLWTKERLLYKAKLLKIDERIDFSKVTEEHIINCYSKIPVTCKKCYYEWSPAIDSIFNSKH